jgi:hypothetical protein
MEILELHLLLLYAAHGLVTRHKHGQNTSRVPAADVNWIETSSDVIQFIRPAHTANLRHSRKYDTKDEAKP